MAKREQKRLGTDKEVRALAKPGRHGDGGNLFLVVSKSGAKKWSFIFRWQGRLTEMGLGPLDKVGLADARRNAEAARALLGRGVSPLEARRAEEEAAAKQRSIPTFGAFALELLDTIEEGFDNAKHRQQWRSTLTTYAAPIWNMPIDHVATEHVLKCLRPIWQKKAETGSRVRGRIERVLNAAKAREFRTGENPAAWRGHLSELLGKRKKLTRGHHASLPYSQMDEFMVELRQREAIAALALEFCILCASRTSEALGARWSEINLDKAVWTIAPERMKSRRPHAVPLSSRAMEIVKTLSEARVGEFVFPGYRDGRSLSTGAFDALLERMGYAGETDGKPHITAHGFRSSFRDWAGNETPFPRELAEHALAHVIGDKAEQSYRRSDALEKRRAMMEAWSQWCQPKAGNVVSFQRASA